METLKVDDALATTRVHILCLIYVPANNRQYVSFGDECEALERQRDASQQKRITFLQKKIRALLCM
jgi:hypothetical protein